MGKVESLLLDSPLSQGDCVTTYEAFGQPDAIITANGRFDAKELKSYLKILELVVLYEKIGVITGVAGSIGRIWITPTTGLSLRAKERLNEERILMQAQLKFTGPSPRDYLDKFLPLSEELQSRLEADRSFVAEHELGEPTRELSMRRLENDFEPLVISDEAAKGGIPYFFSDHEHAQSIWSERMEIHLTRGLMELLRAQLDAGAAEIYSRLEQVGTPVVFPATPIAATIIDEAKSPEDMLQVALQLRTDAKRLRSQLIEFEKNLFNDQVSLKEKSRILLDIQALSDELWHSKDSALQRESLVLPGLVAAVATDLTVGTIGSLISSLASAPFSLLRKALRRRRVRVLLKAKKGFLSGTDRLGKLATLFGIEKDGIRLGFDNERS